MSNSHSDDTEADFEEPNLSTTVDTFASRIQRRIREQALERDQSRQEEKIRHARLLKAMSAIRKALQETHKIQLGERCFFELHVTDWQGWPRVDLFLRDVLAPEQAILGLVVTANDHNNQGRIIFRSLDDKPLGLLEVARPEEFQKLPLLLKRIVREFLDTSSNYVLNPPRPEEILSQQTKQIALDPGEDEKGALFEEKVTGDGFYVDDFAGGNDNLVDTLLGPPLAQPTLTKAKA